MAPFSTPNSMGHLSDAHPAPQISSLTDVESQSAWEPFSPLKFGSPWIDEDPELTPERLQHRRHQLMWSFW